MAGEEIVQNLLTRLGQSQDDRMATELTPGFVGLDERDPAGMLAWMRAFAQLVAFFDVPGEPPSSTGSWEPFLHEVETNLPRVLDGRDGDLTPHLALLSAFARLYEHPRSEINALTLRHLDFFYEGALRFVARPAVADHAHLLVELKKGAPPVAIEPEHRFVGAPDGQERAYAPVRTVVVNHARVESLRAVYLAAQAGAPVRFAPKADSADGLGGKLPPDTADWRGFGHAGLPPAEIGFAFASPVLRMREGTRVVTLSLRVAGLPSTVTANPSLLANNLTGFVTGEKSWLGPYLPSASRTGDRVDLAFTIPAEDPAVVDYTAAVHGYAYAAAGPVLQVLVKSGSAVGYTELRDVTVLSARVKVDVKGVTTLQLESDAGSLNPKKAFLPFGPQPVVGSRFQIGCAEALSKKLSSLTLTLGWQGVPSDLTHHYQSYGVSGIGDQYFTADVAFNDGGSWYHSSSVALVAGRSAAGERVLTFSPSTSSATNVATLLPNLIYGLSIAGTAWATALAWQSVLASPMLQSFLGAPPESRRGFISLALRKGFLQDTYRIKQMENVLKYGRGTVDSLVLLNEPYVPSVQHVSLGYVAHSDEVSLSSTLPTDFANRDVQFFHVGAFGQMREHAYQREQFGFLTDKRVHLLPQYEPGGHLCVGISGLQAGDSVSLLLQCAEGSADPDIEPPTLTWSVLCDNYWKTLTASELVTDTTRNLRASGVLAVVVPPEATTSNTILPAGMIWLRGRVAGDVTGVCRLVQVSANAVEVSCVASAGAPGRARPFAPAGSITRLRTGIAGVKGITQPYDSFGGRSPESPESLRTRAAERLRHKARAVTPWDYERIVLEAFPEVHKVKCIPHAREGSWLSPGNVLIVVVPDLRNRNAIDPLQPRVDAGTLARIEDELGRRVGMGVRFDVRNPRYQRVKLDFDVRFHARSEFNFYRRRLESELVAFMSPWAFAAEAPILFGGSMHKSVLLAFVERREYVDYVTDFKMYTYVGAPNAIDVNAASTSRPDAILVSEAAHEIRQVP